MSEFFSPTSNTKIVLLAAPVSLETYFQIRINHTNQYHNHNNDSNGAGGIMMEVPPPPPPPPLLLISTYVAPWYAILPSAHQYFTGVGDGNIQKGSTTQ